VLYRFKTVLTLSIILVGEILLLVFNNRKVVFILTHINFLHVELLWDLLSCEASHQTLEFIVNNWPLQVNQTIFQAVVLVKACQR
jgi:hypothetical protein